tara:strand:- start:3227 stop:3922 length:696 start_codon:yes stop_codon:yes gene_type:complete
VLVKDDMRIESKLCHITENKAVVQANGWLNNQRVGSALGEGSTVELAEDNAISRLNKRLNGIDKSETNKNVLNDKLIQKPIRVELSHNEKIEKINFKEEPSDWSSELTAIDLEIERLNWSRDDEIKFLEKSFGYNNRNRITKYYELIDYLKKLKAIDNISPYNQDTKYITKMIEESDNILRDLSWDHEKGREYLMSEFDVSSRKELDETQLRLFVSKLKAIRKQYFENQKY